MTPQFFLRQAAEKDLEDVWLYTFEVWGLEQADCYVDSLLNRFAWLAENPHSGKQRPDIKPGYICFPEGRHLIFYRLQGDGIEIIGVLHQSMDYHVHFEPDRN